jgi:EAL domain-containing protein (putative c-di-GMP-specific phosphodiesterase class I)
MAATYQGRGQSVADSTDEPESDVGCRPCPRGVRLGAVAPELEITEAVLMQNTEATIATLHRLRDIGVHITMDDFGTGYSSLSYLRSFPFEKIKIDRSFIKSLGEGEESSAIVRAVAGLAQSLRKTTTAEGVETEQQMQHVRSLGCTEMQGFLFSPPVRVADVARLFKTPPEPRRAVA